MCIYIHAHTHLDIRWFFHTYLCFLSISFGMPVLPVVKVTRACSTDAQSSGSSNFTAPPVPPSLDLSSVGGLELLARLLISRCIEMERNDGRRYCRHKGEVILYPYFETSISVNFKENEVKCVSWQNQIGSLSPSLFRSHSLSLLLSFSRPLSEIPPSHSP